MAWLGKVGVVVVLSCLLSRTCNAGISVVSRSSSQDGTVVTVNGQTYTPGEYDVDGSHIQYEQQGQNDGSGASYSFVRVSSDDGRRKVDMKKQGVDSASERRRGQGEDPMPRRRPPLRQEDPADPGEEEIGTAAARRRHTLERKFFDTEQLLEEMRAHQWHSEHEDSGPGDSAARSARDESGGSGAAGERREAHVDLDGARGSARTSGHGPHSESVEASTTRTPGGATVHSVRASASSSSKSSGAS